MLKENDAGVMRLLTVCRWHATKPAKTASDATSRRLFIEAPDKGGPLEGKPSFDNMKHAANDCPGKY